MENFLEKSSEESPHKLPTFVLKLDAVICSRRRFSTITSILSEADQSSNFIITKSKFKAKWPIFLRVNVLESSWFEPKVSKPPRIVPADPQLVTAGVTPVDKTQSFALLKAPVNSLISAIGL